MRYTEYRFGPNETIDAIIQLKNMHNVSREELAKLREDFNVLNNYSIIKIGETRRIPILERYYGSFGNLIEFSQK